MKTCKRGHEKSPQNTSKTGQCKACMRKWRQDHPEACRSIGKGYARRRRMRDLYHLTEAEYAEMYERQEGLCILPSCMEPATDIDHCHVTHRTRGLMCNKHNLAIGLFADSPRLLREAAEYLENFNGK
jgi:hypothetical protein